MPSPLRDLGQLLGRIVRAVRIASYSAIVLAAIWIVVQVVDVHRMLADVHPALGLAFLVAFVGLFGLFVVRPLVRFLEVPVVLRPPVLPEPGARRARHLVKHLVFVGRYLDNVARNPAWDGDRARLADAQARVAALRREASSAGEEALADLAARTDRLERGLVAEVIAPLDRQATEMIRQEAMRVGLATAVSPYGRLDAFFVLWRNMNLVAGLARIYYGRPGTRGTLGILRDVSLATLASAWLEEMSDLAGDMVAGFVGRSAGVFAGPLLDGSLNAVATLRIGYVARARCRALAAWTPRTRADAVRGALREAAALSRGVVGDIVRTVGGGILRIPGKVLGGILERVGTLFRPRPQDGGATAPEGAT